MRTVKGEMHNTSWADMELSFIIRMWSFEMVFAIVGMVRLRRCIFYLLNPRYLRDMVF